MVKWHRMRRFLTGQLRERADEGGGKEFWSRVNCCTFSLSISEGAVAFYRFYRFWFELRSKSKCCVISDPQCSCQMCQFLKVIYIYAVCFCFLVHNVHNLMISRFFKHLILYGAHFRWVIAESTFQQTQWQLGCAPTDAPECGSKQV